MLMHLSAGRLVEPSIRHPDAVLHAAHVEIVNERVPCAALDATKADTRATKVVENCMLKEVGSVGVEEGSDMWCLGEELVGKKIILEFTVMHSYTKHEVVEYVIGLFCQPITSSRYYCPVRMLMLAMDPSHD